MPAAAMLYCIAAIASAAPPCVSARAGPSERLESEPAGMAASGGRLQISSQHATCNMRRITHNAPHDVQPCSMQRAPMQRATYTLHRTARNTRGEHIHQTTDSRQQAAGSRHSGLQRTLSSVSALMQFPRADSDRLMPFASSSRCPVAPVLPTFSDPAPLGVVCVPLYARACDVTSSGAAAMRTGKVDRVTHSANEQDNHEPCITECKRHILQRAIVQSNTQHTRHAALTRQRLQETNAVRNAN
jgi:hypothetical protein